MNPQSLSGGLGVGGNSKDRFDFLPSGEKIWSRIDSRLIRILDNPKKTWFCDEHFSPQKAVTFYFIIWPLMRLADTPQNAALPVVYAFIRPAICIITKDFRSKLEFRLQMCASQRLRYSDRISHSSRWGNDLLTFFVCSKWFLHRQCFL